MHTILYVHTHTILYIIYLLILLYIYIIKLTDYIMIFISRSIFTGFICSTELLEEMLNVLFYVTFEEASHGPGMQFTFESGQRINHIITEVVKKDVRHGHNGQ